MSRKPISIFHIIPQLNVGGAERVVMDLMLHGSGDFTQTLVSLKPIPPAGQPWKQELETRRIRVIEIGQSHPGDLFALLRLRRFFKKEQPDIVHTHLFGGDLYGRLAARFTGIRRVLSTEHNVNRSETVVHRFVRRLIAPLATAIVAVSKTVKESAAVSEGASKQQLRLIYNGIETKKFSCPLRREFSNPVRLGTVGRLSPQKNHRLLLKALARLKEISTSSFVCEIAGEGELHAALETEVKRLALTNQVRLMGRQNNIPGFLKRLDVFILPSSWEGLPLALLEAGAAGLPIVASAIEPIKEIMTDNVDGFLFAPDSAVALSDRLADCLGDSAHAVAMAKVFHKKVSTQFDVSIMVKHYEELYRAILNKS